MSYVEAAREAIRAGEQLHAWLARQLERRAGELWFAIATTLAMLLVQAVWLASAFVIGNLISLGFGPRAETEGKQVPTWTASCDSCGGTPSRRHTYCSA